VATSQLGNLWVVGSNPASVLAGWDFIWKTIFSKRGENLFAYKTIFYPTKAVSFPSNDINTLLPNELFFCCQNFPESMITRIHKNKYTRLLGDQIGRILAICTIVYMRL
jgi:hypothetical protein